jgi:hypothetical protein
MVSSILKQLSLLGTSINVDETNFEFLTFVTIDSACMPVVVQVDVEDEMLLLGLSHTLIIWQIAAPSLSSYLFVNEITVLLIRG